MNVSKTELSFQTSGEEDLEPSGVFVGIAGLDCYWR